jgi:hypothetical protein
MLHARNEEFTVYREIQLSADQLNQLKENEGKIILFPWIHGSDQGGKSGFFWILIQKNPKKSLKSKKIRKSAFSPLFSTP